MLGVLDMVRRLRYESVYAGDAYDHLVALLAQHCITKAASPHSKKWWNSDMSRQLGKTRGTKGKSGHNEERKILRGVSRRSKKETWKKFVYEQANRSPWEIARIARDHQTLHGPHHGRGREDCQYGTRKD